MTAAELFLPPVMFVSVVLVMTGSTMALAHRTHPFGALTGNGMAISGWAGLLWMARQTDDWLFLALSVAAIFWNVRQVHNLRSRI